MQLFKRKHIIHCSMYIIYSLLISCTQPEVVQKQQTLRIAASSGLIIGKKRWPSCNIGWNIVGSFSTEQTEAITAAMNEINRAKVYFTLQRNSNPLLKVAFTTPEQVGKNETEGLITYHKPALATIEGNLSNGYTIYLNQSHIWTPVQLKSVVMNQLGEIMGLNPSNQSASIMFPFLNPSNPVTLWNNYDVAALKQLYPESGLPLVTTGQVLLISNTKSHSVEASVTNTDNVPDISNLGIVWSSTNPMPTIDNFEGRMGNGNAGKSLNISLWELKTNTRYYIRAYASNACGIGYGAVVDFIKP